MEPEKREISILEPSLVKFYSDSISFFSSFGDFWIIVINHYSILKLSFVINSLWTHIFLQIIHEKY